MEARARSARPADRPHPRPCGRSAGWAAALCAVLLWGLSGCAGPLYWHSAGTMQDLLSTPASAPLVDSAASLPAEVPGEPRLPYRIGIGDELSVTLWGRADLGSQLPDRGNNRRDVSIVDPDGMIHLPLIDPVHCAGRTLDEVRADLVREYAAIVPKTDLNVDVVTYRSKSVRVLGEVRKSGLFYISDTLRTVGQAIASAGGLAADADGAHGILIRDGRRYELPYRGGTRGKNPVLQVRLDDADTIYFPTTQERVVYVVGEVFQQGKVPIPDRGLLLLDALSQAQGPRQDSASYDHIFLVRHQADGAHAYELTMKELLDGPDVALAPGDRVVVPPSRLSNWERFWRKFLPLFNSLLGFGVTGVALGL